MQHRFATPPTQPRQSLLSAPKIMRRCDQGPLPLAVTELLGPWTCTRAHHMLTEPLHVEQQVDLAKVWLDEKYGQQPIRFDLRSWGHTSLTETLAKDAVFDYKISTK